MLGITIELLKANSTEKARKTAVYGLNSNRHV